MSTIDFERQFAHTVLIDSQNVKTLAESKEQSRPKYETSTMGALDNLISLRLYLVYISISSFPSLEKCHLPTVKLLQSFDCSTLAPFGLSWIFSSQ
jgi:hypothetical protein